MYYYPNSCLVMFFLFSLIQPLTCESRNQDVKLCETLFRCGNITAGHPFWGGNRQNHCGYPLLQLQCNKNITSFIISNQEFYVLHINQTSYSLTLARTDLLGPICNSSFTSTTLPQEIFELSPTYKSLNVFYYCFFENHHLSGYYCPMRKFILVSENAEYRNSCSESFIVNVPTSFVADDKEEFNMTNFESVLSKGFEVKLKMDEIECQECSSSHGSCDVNKTLLLGHKCSPIHPPPPSTGKSKGAIAGIAAGASVLGFATLVVACWFCIIRRRKKTQSAQYTSKDLPVTSYSSRETSRTPTSTTISSSSNHSLLPSISNLPYGSSYYGVQVYSYEELEEATENFSRELGDGGFGTVYYGKLKDGRSVAVKRLYERSLKRVEQFKNEIEILKSLKHPNLVILYGCTSRHSRELLLVYEYISNGTLAEHLHGDHAPLCWSVRLKVAIETASALSYLHKSGIIHRDVKTTNILLDENYQVKVADFGLSRLFPMDQTHISTAPQGTPGYVDPEYYQCYRLNEKSDVYSFGVVLTELISSKEAVDITRHRHDINLANMAISKIQNNALHELVDPSLGFEKDPDVKKRMMSVAELAFRCLQQEREVRPSMDEIVEILEEIQGKNRVMVSPPDVVDVDGSNGGGGDDVGLLRHSVPPPISPETDKWTSSSDTAASL